MLMVFLFLNLNQFYDITPPPHHTHHTPPTNTDPTTANYHKPPTNNPPSTVTSLNHQNITQPPTVHSIITFTYHKTQTHASEVGSVSDLTCITCLSQGKARWGAKHSPFSRCSGLSGLDLRHVHLYARSHDTNSTATHALKKTRRALSL
jgi:hypothetical protein